MALSFFSRILGSRNQRLIKGYQKTVKRINALEPEYEKLTDEQLKAKTETFRQRVQGGESLNKLLPEAYAVVREAAKRVMGMRHYDVQMFGGIALHEGKIAEMRTGEGKTLTSTLPVYLNALGGKGVHVVTVNNYLASRDAQWMGKLYSFLGLTVAANVPELDKAGKQAAYACDITYGTNSEFGFDYLRDNMVYAPTERVQRGLHYAIIDEVDSILIDEARTPLIISGQTEDNVEMYPLLKKVADQLEAQEGEEHPVTGEGVIKAGDFTLEEKGKQAHLTERGHEKAEQLMIEVGLLPEGASLYDAANITLMHHLNAAIRARHFYLRDQQYVVQNGEVIIVDEFTGRLMPGRRWADGLMQAVEAREGVEIQPENQTLGTITFQNYFRLFEKLAGMTGTADTEAYEFQQIYHLETVVIPTNRPSQRDDQLDLVYKTSDERYQAAVEDIRVCHERGQPVLVGTGSIENSELIASLLKKAELPHQVLNAKQHEKEAEVIAQAGRPGMITIATNMAGRGTDIVLGGSIEARVKELEADESLDESATGKAVTELRESWKTDHEKVKALGGLRIVATERNESRRIDNQLRGRSGRQGDPGSSRFYISLEDPLMRIFAGDRIKKLMTTLKMPEGEAIEAKMVTRTIEGAQRKVEQHNFDARKQLLEYDDVANEQRKVVYEQRNDILDSEGIRDQINYLRESCFTDLTRTYIPHESVEEQWDTEGLQAVLNDEWQVGLDLKTWLESEEIVSDQDVVEKVVTAADQAFADKMEQVGDSEQFSRFKRMVMLQSLDNHWREHLTALDHLRKGIHLRSYAQKQPKQEYKREAFEMFAAMLDSIKNEVTQVLMNVRIQAPEELGQAAEKLEERGESVNINVRYSSPDETGGTQMRTAEQVAADSISEQERGRFQDMHVGRNQPCPCGSGKKYKNCHGKLS